MSISPTLICHPGMPPTESKSKSGQTSNNHASWKPDVELIQFHGLVLRIECCNQRVARQQQPIRHCDDEGTSEERRKTTGEKIIVQRPSRWPKNENRSRDFIPTESASGANANCETAKPQRAAPPIQPTSSFVSTNSRFRASITAPTVTNAADVAIRATQLPKKKAIRVDVLVFCHYSVPKVVGEELCESQVPEDIRWWRVPLC